MLRIFISYRQDDSLAQAMALYGLLAQRLGEDNIFIDKFGIQPGEHWLAKLKRELVRSDVQLVLIGPGWLTAKDEEGRLRLGDVNDVVTLEIAAALERKANVIPVLLQGTKMPEEKKLPQALKKLALTQCFSIEQMMDGEEIDNLISILSDLPKLVPDVLGGCFHLEGQIGKTRHTNIYLAVPESEARSFDTVAVHTLRQESESEERDWFERRCSLWQRVPHTNVVAQHELSDCSVSAKVPYFAIITHTDNQTLDNEIKDKGGLDRKRIVEVLTTVSDICESAHKQGILLQSLEPLHFWNNTEGELCYEGFDAAVAMGKNSGKQGKMLRKYCLAPERLAPEVGTLKAGRTVDIFALGMLLKAMELESGQPFERLTGNERREPWAALAFHCLWMDPGGRFQHMAQFRHFLVRCSKWRDFIPDVVVLNDDFDARHDSAEFVSSESMKYIGCAPVMNIEYEHFCFETGYPLHRSDSNSQRIASRVQGPLCPVVNVNMNDARKYCEWLSIKTGQKYRLPTEAEWMQAAVGSENNVHDGTEANCGNRYGGPTVVGAFNISRSDAGCWDMLGNVWEWCSDRYGQETGLRILKGGSYSCSKSALGSAGYHTAVRTCRASNIGFRVLKEG